MHVEGHVHYRIMIAPARPSPAGAAVVAGEITGAIQLPRAFSVNRNAPNHRRTVRNLCTNGGNSAVFLGVNKNFWGEACEFKNTS